MIACAKTGETYNLRQKAIKNKKGDVIGFVYVAGNLNIDDLRLSIRMKPTKTDEGS